MSKFYKIASVVYTYIEAETEEEAFDKLENDDFIIQHRVETQSKEVDEDEVRHVILN